MSELRRIVTSMAMAVLAVALVGCKPSTNLVRPCCYKGEVALLHLADTKLVLEDGATVAFGDVFSGFSADSDSFARVFPFEKADIGLVTFQSLRDVLPSVRRERRSHPGGARAHRPLRPGSGTRTGLPGGAHRTERRQRSDCDISGGCLGPGAVRRTPCARDGETATAHLPRPVLVGNRGRYAASLLRRRARRTRSLTGRRSPSGPPCPPVSRTALCGHEHNRRCRNYRWRPAT